MDKGREAALHALIADVLAFYRQDVNEFTLSVWRQACEGFELEQVRKALTAHAMDPDRGQFAPKPADLVRALQGTQADRSLIAWGQVLDAIRRVGAYQSVEFPDKAIHAAIADMGGWPAVCRTETDDLPFVQKRFCEAHRTYSQRGHQAAPRLSGDHEQTNALRGHATPVVQIGTPGRLTFERWSEARGACAQSARASDDRRGCRDQCVDGSSADAAIRAGRRVVERRKAAADMAPVTNDGLGPL